MQSQKQKQKTQKKKNPLRAHHVTALTGYYTYINWSSLK